MIYIVHQNTDLVSFMLSGIEESYIDIPFYKDYSIFRKIEERFLRFNILFPSIFSRYFFFSRLKNIPKGSIVIFWGFNDIYLLKKISCALHPTIKKYIWQWNPIDVVYPENALHNINNIKKLGFIYTCFDEYDAKNYNLICKGQIYPAHNFIINSELDIDFCYVGATKDRMDIILQIEEGLTHFKCVFKKVSTPSEYIPYRDYLAIVSRSKCVIDIVQKRQHGLTLRPIEAMFQKKKLLTNCTSISRYDFYNPNNIFIWGVDSIERLFEFLVSPYEEVSDSIKKKYDINTWINSYK